MRVKSLSIFFNWIVCGMGLFGISQYIGQVGGDIFINFAVSGAIQIPGNFVAWWAMNSLGRRITLICSNSITGVACLFLIIVSNRKKSCYVNGLLLQFFFYYLLLTSKTSFAQKLSLPHFDNYFTNLLKCFPSWRLSLFIN